MVSEMLRKSRPGPSSAAAHKKTEDKTALRNVVNLWMNEDSTRFPATGGAGYIKLHETLPLLPHRPKNDWRLALRKQRARKIDLAVKPSPPLCSVSFKPERISILRSLLAQRYGNINKWELSDYVAIGKKDGKGEVCVTFRSPHQLAYSEAQVMFLKNQALSRHTAGNPKTRSNNNSPITISQGTQTIQFQQEEQDEETPITVNKDHSELYCYRYLTAGEYADVANCSYLRPRHKLAGRKKTTGEKIKKKEDNMADYRIDVKLDSGEQVVTGQPPRMLLHPLPPLKQAKSGSLRRQQNKNLHASLSG